MNTSKNNIIAAAIVAVGMIMMGYNIQKGLENGLQDERIVSLPAPMCRLSEYGSSSLNYLVRCWVPNGLYWDVRFDLNELIFTHLKNNGVEIPFNQLDVHVISEQNTNGEEA